MIKAPLESPQHHTPAVKMSAVQTLASDETPSLRLPVILKPLTYVKAK